MKSIHIYFICDKEPYIPLQELFLAQEFTDLGFHPVVIPVLASDDTREVVRITHEDDSCKAVLFWHERMTVCARNFHKTIELSKHVRGKTRYVGGIFATLYAKEMVEDTDHFDSVIVGFDLQKVAEYVSFGEPKPIFEALGDIDLNRYHLEFSPLRRKELYGEKMYGYYVSNSCKNNCKFCLIATKKQWGIRYSVRTLELVKEDIDAMVETFNCTAVSFKDADFFSLPHAFEILDYLKEKGLKTTKNIDITLNKVSRDLVERLVVDYGIRFLFFGLESFKQENLKKISKPSNIKRIHEIAKWIDEYDIRLYGNLIFALPWQDQDEIMEELRNAFYLMNTTKNIIINASPYIPIPETQLYKEYFQDDTTMDYMSKIAMFDPSFLKRHFPYQAGYRDDPNKLRKHMRVWINFSKMKKFYLRHPVSLAVTSFLLKDYQRSILKMSHWRMAFWNRVIRFTYTKAFRKIAIPLLEKNTDFKTLY